VTDWTRVEVEATIADYFAMLEAELRGEDYSKTEHRRQLSKLLDKRSDGAIERKHMNISAVLIELGLPYIDGYKPYRNYQQMLFDVVEERVQGSKSLVAAVATDVGREVEPPTVDDILSALVDPPSSRGSRSRRYPKASRERRTAPRLGVNYLERESQNRSLGAAGEEFVARFEQARLLSMRLEKLAARVERVSTTKGDGLGYDILSFEKSGADRLIEVKTTSYGQETPFFVSRNELSVSREQGKAYHLYRVFSFRKAPRLFWKKGPLDHDFALDPVQYLARIA
jgi:hypothetical protein